MKLKDFVKESIKEIVNGVEESYRYAEDKGAIVNPGTQRHVENIEFDVSVVAQDGKETKGGIGIFVGAVGLGSQGASKENIKSENRLRFKIPIVLPGERSMKAAGSTYLEIDSP